ncbi:S-adenosyl-L-methionine-dependent methyltransferase, partial [Cinara cedri]
MKTIQKNCVQPNSSTEVYRRRQEVLRRRHRDRDPRTEPRQKVLDTKAPTFRAVRRRHTSGPHSVCSEVLAKHIADRCRFPDGIAVDPFCGAGGNVIQLAKTCRR